MELFMWILIGLWAFRGLASLFHLGRGTTTKVGPIDYSISFVSCIILVGIGLWLNT